MLILYKNYMGSPQLKVFYTSHAQAHGVDAGAKQHNLRYAASLSKQLNYMLMRTKHTQHVVAAHTGYQS